MRQYKAKPSTYKLAFWTAAASLALLACISIYQAHVISYQSKTINTLWIALVQGENHTAQPQQQAMRISRLH